MYVCSVIRDRFDSSLFVHVLTHNDVIGQPLPLTTFTFCTLTLDSDAEDGVVHYFASYSRCAEPPLPQLQEQDNSGLLDQDPLPRGVSPFQTGHFGSCTLLLK